MSVLAPPVHDERQQRQPRAIVCLILVAVNCAVAVALPLTCGSEYPSNPIPFGANWRPLTFGWEPWRLITAQFIHIEFFHLFFNMVGLWFGGRYLERAVGGLKFLAIYLASGVAANLAALVARPFDVSYGASGGVLGVMVGSLVVYLVRSMIWKQRPILTLSLIAAIAAYLAFVAPPVASKTPHLVALAAGSLLALFFLRRTDDEVG